MWFSPSAHEPENMACVENWLHILHGIIYCGAVLQLCQQLTGSQPINALETQGRYTVSGKKRYLYLCNPQKTQTT
jgi:hypothetical protein